MALLHIILGFEAKAVLDVVEKDSEVESSEVDGLFSKHRMRRGRKHGGCSSLFLLCVDWGCYCDWSSFMGNRWQSRAEEGFQLRRRVSLIALGSGGL